MTATVSLATTPADARAVDAVQEHHAELLGALSTHVERLLTAVRRHDEAAWEAPRDALTHWCEHELVPHAVAEEAALYPAAAGLGPGRLLIAAMTAEHTTIRRLVSELAAADEPVGAAATGVALRVVFESHMTTENEQILPLLAGDPATSLADLLEGMHDALGEAAFEGGHVEPQEAHSGHVCACHEADEELPELDARLVPHAIRHATIFGALDAVRPGHGLVLVAPHDPLPLLAQVEERDPGAFAVDYLERGPEAWRLHFQRSA